MKIRFYLAMAVAALVMTNCSQDEELVQVQQGSNGFTATIEESSRSAVTDEGVFSWTVGDKFSVWNGTTFDVYANSEANVGYFEPSGTVGTPTGYAIYPSGSHAISGNTVTVNLPATYSHGSTNAAMLAAIETGSTNLAFKHLGGLMRFNVENVPANATSFVFTATDDILTGNYSVDSEGEIKKDGENTVNNNNSVTITFDALTAAQDMTFYVPLPVGTYGEYKVEIKGEGIELSHTSTGVTNTIGRRTLLLMPTFTVDGTELKKGAGNVIPVTQEEANVSGNQSLTINAEGADATATLVLNYTPQEGNATLSLSDGSDAATPQTSAATVKVIPTTTTPVEALNINTPTLTVELGAGEYGTVEALTATQTLIIGAGVTIDELVLNGGNLTIDKNAIVNNITLNADVVLNTGLWIRSDNCVIDLNGHSITRSSGGAIYVASGKKLTIGGDEEGSLVESTHEGGAAIWNMAGTLVINSGTYKNSGPQIAAIYCDRINEDGTTKKGTWNLTINGGTFISENFTAVSLQNNRTDSEHTDYAEGLADINGGTFTAGGVWYDLYLANVVAEIEGGNCTFTNNKVLNYTRNKINGSEMGTENSYICFAETQLNAVATAGGRAVLGANIDLNSGLWIGNDCEIDLNGHYIKRSSGGAIYVKSGKKLTIGGDEEGSLVESTHEGGAAIWNMAGTLVINSGTYKNSGPQIAAIYCDRINEDGTTKKGTWNLTINGGTFISENFTAVSLQNNRTDSEHTDYAEGLADINGGTFTAGGVWYDLYLANVVAEIERDNCTFTNNKVLSYTRNKIDGTEQTTDNEYLFAE